ncbi:uncharacterized protein EDB91DRAFT_1057077 [Suillus paluster]|uniref:uncharacterized protein n=1 Tax=Suillus paluster TaxID=48578 RepID=UPI001B86636D|nr:uncharacterized protein EDB91DRAFT_1057077 [Suillus paluster]KAG1734103.1 hypothetical protein EDB91DRAFT_1057077 [Suillus paluster]
MGLAAAFRLLPELRLIIGAGLWPTILAVWHSPSLLFRPHELSRLFMFHVWKLFGNGVDENARDVKKALITPHTYGVVLDIGAGHGHTIKYLEHSHVTKYIAVEPNVHMHAELHHTASATGYSQDDGTLLILPCGTEDITTIISSFPVTHPPVNTLISVLTICSIPSPQSTISTLISEVLKPGGQVLYYKHVLSDKNDVVWWQRFWTPVWSTVFGGCHLDCPAHQWIEDVGGWVQGEGGMWKKEGETEEGLFCHRGGRLIKVA